MDLQAIFTDEATACAAGAHEPQEAHEPLVSDIGGTWSEWLEERDGRLSRVIQRDGEEVVPWDKLPEWPK